MPARPGAELFPRIAVTMLGILPMMVMFLVTSVSMQRERTSGTLERLWTTAIHRADLLFGYAAAFTTTAIVQALVLCAVAYWFLRVETAGSPGWVILVAAVDAMTGVALGLLASAFARTEFQAVQFMPVVIGPQIFLCGLLVPGDQMPYLLDLAAHAMPMTYAVDALGAIRTQDNLDSDFGTDLIVLVVFGVIALLAAAATMPRQSR